MLAKQLLCQHSTGATQDATTSNRRGGTNCVPCTQTTDRWVFYSPRLCLVLDYLIEIGKDLKPRPRGSLGCLWGPLDDSFAFWSHNSQNLTTVSHAGITCCSLFVDSIAF